MNDCLISLANCLFGSYRDPDIQRLGHSYQAPAQLVGIHPGPNVHFWLIPIHFLGTTMKERIIRTKKKKKKKTW